MLWFRDFCLNGEGGGRGQVNACLSSLSKCRFLDVKIFTSNLLSNTGIRSFSVIKIFKLERKGGDKTQNIGIRNVPKFSSYLAIICFLISELAPVLVLIYFGLTSKEAKITQHPHAVRNFAHAVIKL